MNKKNLTLALMLVLTASFSVFADGETGHVGRSIIDYIYDSFGNVIGYIWG